MKKIYIKQRNRRKGQFQFYMHQFVETLEKAGVNTKKDIIFTDRFKVGGVIRHFLIFAYKFFRNKKKRQALIVTSRGEDLIYNAAPYFIKYEIIPMLWDVWPYCWNQLIAKLVALNVKTVLVTARSVAAMLHEKLNINAIWIPEGIDLNLYKKGKELIKRDYDIYELGRQHPKYHQVLVQMYKKKMFVGYFHNEYGANGKIIKLAFNRNENMIDAFSKVKIVINFPKVDTEPFLAGNVETLTQRYWEAMLSRCLMIGRAPKELIDLLGYNPVIEVDWDIPQKQLSHILSNISIYQELVNRNFKQAIKLASWEARVPYIKGKLQDLGYSI